MSSAGIGYAAKDLVVTTSGDRLVGKIKKVEKDVLTLSTDYSDSDFKIKWDKIASAIGISGLGSLAISTAVRRQVFQKTTTAGPTLLV